jgi:hypothetical protein
MNHDNGVNIYLWNEAVRRKPSLYLSGDANLRTLFRWVISMLSEAESSNQAQTLDIQMLEGNAFRFDVSACYLCFTSSTMCGISQSTLGLEAIGLNLKNPRSAIQKFVPVISALTSYLHIGGVQDAQLIELTTSRGGLVYPVSVRSVEYGVIRTIIDFDVDTDCIAVVDLSEQDVVDICTEILGFKNWIVHCRKAKYRLHRLYSPGSKGAQQSVAGDVWPAARSDAPERKP